MISRETVIGILITILFHMVLALFIVSIRIRELNNVHEQRFEMSIASEVVEKPVDLQKMEEVNKEVLDQIYEEIKRQEAAADRSNISVNVNEKFKGEVSTEKYLQKLQSELGLKNANLGGNGDVSQNNSQTKILEDIHSESNPENATFTLKKLPPIKGKRIIYNGPTNIYYDLAGRHDVNMIVPVYKCQGSGRVVVDISVSPSGSVINASINQAQTISDECFRDAAFKAASNSLFNSDAKATAVQKGTITYQFVAQ